MSEKQPITFIGIFIFLSPLLRYGVMIIRDEKYYKRYTNISQPSMRRLEILTLKFQTTIYCDLWKQKTIQINIHPKRIIKL